MRHAMLSHRVDGPQPTEVAMNLFAAARRMLGMTSRRSSLRGLDDPGDMGTAFGLDAITVLETDTQPATYLDEPLMPTPSRFEDRLHRRSGL